MCGIAGIFYFKHHQVKPKFNHHQKILDLLKHRGPDFQQYKHFDRATLYHSRLIILDPTAHSHQPYQDHEKNEALVFNGEIFNYKTLPHNNPEATGDVEVLFQHIKKNGIQNLDQLNGFFAFAFYDIVKHNLLLVRDRLGVKPLYYYSDEEKLVFASELKPLLEIIGPQELNSNQLYSYLRLNYCAGEETIFKNVYRLLPGCCLEVNEGGVNRNAWYKVAKKENSADLNDLMQDAVKLRLHADVPVGCYLSGGLDSSIISAIAKQQQPNINTFSIGFADHKFLDESAYAEKMANHLQTQHHSFKLKEDDFLDHLSDFLICIDEPFADSSAFNFYLLSHYAHKKVKVALSGDGADELFKGYHKHRALFLSQKRSVKNTLRILSPFARYTNSSRESGFENKMRKIKKFDQLMQLDPFQKHQFLASISQDEDVRKLMKVKASETVFENLFLTSTAYRHFGIDEAFDLQTVLSDDMLVKADRFSMQQGIEIRNPFLDHRIVEYALNLDNSKKIGLFQQKIILKKTFGYLLPSEILNRKKKGFELPLKSWLCGQLKQRLENDWLNKDKIEAEGLLNNKQIEHLKIKLFSNDPGDSAAQIWALVVFENWIQNFKSYIKPNA